MVDLQGQYHRLKEEIDVAMQTVIESSAFINGPQVKAFGDHLADYLDIPYVVPCGNGTDALQIALMALQLQPGDEVIVPAFTYVAAAEVIALLGLTPVLVDVDPRTYNIDPRKIEESISRNTKAIIVVHLFGQSCDMAPILRIAGMYHLHVIEDNAQSVGAEYTFPDGQVKKTGTMGVIGTTSFFPSKPLACFGDGGALMTSDESLAKRIRMIANHGQEVKYHHKLKARQVVARRYDEGLASCEQLILPKKSDFSTHVYHQYTVQLKPVPEYSDTAKHREALQAALKEKGIPTMVYYPVPLQAQDAYKWMARTPGSMETAARLSNCVLSLPIHTEMTVEEQEYIIDVLVKELENRKI